MRIMEKTSIKLAPQPSMAAMVETLHAGGYSLVVSNGGSAFAFVGRGVSDLFRLLSEQPELLRGATAADKVVGKGAAALMALGGLREVYADVVSEPALELLQKSGVKVTYGSLVPMIWNRARTGSCPVEQLCKDAETAEECFPLIRDFVEKMRG